MRIHTQIEAVRWDCLENDREHKVTLYMEAVVEEACGPHRGYPTIRITDYGMQGCTCCGDPASSAWFPPNIDDLTVFEAGITDDEYEDLIDRVFATYFLNRGTPIIN